MLCSFNVYLQYPPASKNKMYFKDDVNMYKPAKAMALPYKEKDLDGFHGNPHGSHQPSNKCAAQNTYRQQSPEENAAVAPMCPVTQPPCMPMADRGQGS